MRLKRIPILVRWEYRRRTLQPVDAALRLYPILQEPQHLRCSPSGTLPMGQRCGRIAYRHRCKILDVTVLGAYHGNCTEVY